ncbi:cell wall-binding repeat-containing protein [Cellulomonas sp. PSBB021]|uniref:cell wall-binding repeat-containing protein n=1 Tax=Cellulomonas sp. PSBB021 TaxID=2003551 RepID=UPI003519AA1F
MDHDDHAGADPREVPAAVGRGAPRGLAARELGRGHAAQGDVHRRLGAVPPGQADDRRCAHRAGVAARDHVRLPQPRGAPAPDPRSDVQRLSGDDRFATAAAIGRAAFPTGRTVVVVSGQQASLVDGLVAAPYARSIKAPVLLSTRSSVPEASMAEITRRGATSAVLVGGTGVLTTDVSAQLRAAGLSVTRLSGADRYATAAAVARAFGSASSVVVASGVTANLVDAAAAGGPAAASGQPVLLVPRSSVPPATRATITALGARSATIVGGTGVVTSSVADALRADGLRLTRLSGTDRYATAAAVADAYEPSVKAGTVVLASGLDANLVDSLTGGVLGRLTLLTAGAGVPAATDRWFAVREVSLLQVLGGTGAVPDSAVEAVR